MYFWSWIKVYELISGAHGGQGCCIQQSWLHQSYGEGKFLAYYIVSLNAKFEKMWHVVG